MWVSILAASLFATRLETSNGEGGGGPRLQHHDPAKFDTMAHAATNADLAQPSIVFAMGNKQAIVEQLPLVLSSLALADTLAKRPSQNLIVGVQSHEDLHLCQQLHHLCWLDDLKTIPYQETPSKREGKDFLPDEVAGIGWRRLEVVQHVVKNLGLGVLCFDLDLVFFRNPFTILDLEGYSGLDFFIQSEEDDPEAEVALHGGVNGGFYWLAPSEAGVAFMERWLVDRTRWDQWVLQALLRDKAVEGLKWRPLPSSIALSYRHLGKSFQEAAKSDHLGAAVGYFESNPQLWDSLVAFHLPSCKLPTRTVCKSMMMGVALDAKVAWDARQ